MTKNVITFSYIFTKPLNNSNNNDVIRHRNSNDNHDNKGRLRAGLHYQRFCDYSRNFASVNSKF
jgi:hypothetical protein